MALSLQLDRESPVPLARQIQEQIERLIREEWLAPGVKLPATRELAQALGVNRDDRRARLRGAGGGGPGAGARGAGDLRGGVAGRRRAAPRYPSPARVPLDWSRLFSRSAHIASSGAERAGGRFPRSARPLISFAEGTPDSGLFPTDAFRRVLNQVVRDGGLRAPPVPAGR